MTDFNTSALPSPAHAIKAAATPHMQKAATLLSNWAARAAGNGISTTTLLACRMDPQMWTELWHMQEAVWRRQCQMQHKWLQSWTAWTNECTQIRGANTMSKLVEQECDLVAQLHELLSDQATDLVTLLENIQVDYAYWVDEKLRQSVTA
jgi:thioesterase domain-containing protein